MSPKRALLALCIAAMISFGLSLGISAFAQQAETDGDSTLGVEWAYRPDDLADLVAKAPSIVMAEVEAVRAGEPEIIDSNDADGAPMEIPTQLIDVQVTEIIGGAAPQHLTVYQVGGSGLRPDGDPAYVAGERYLLFARPRLNDAGTGPNPDGTWLAVAPDGRLKKASGELDAAIPGPVADQLDGETVQEAKAEITNAAESG